MKLDRSTPVAACILASTFTLVAGAQTRVTPRSNKYTPAEDVKLGREAAAQAEQQFPLLRDDMLTSYVADIGHRLVAAIPADLQHPEFQYSFKSPHRKRAHLNLLLGF
jgi:predicted Zn-dependent protease